MPPGRREGGKGCAAVCRREDGEDCASILRRGTKKGLLQNCFPVSAATVLINISLKTIHAGGFRCAPEERGITACGLAHRLWVYPRFCALQERGSRQTFPPSPARLQRANGMVSLFDLWASPQAVIPHAFSVLCPPCRREDGEDWEGWEGCGAVLRRGTNQDHQLSWWFVLPL